MNYLLYLFILQFQKYNNGKIKQHFKILLDTSVMDLNIVSDFFWYLHFFDMPYSFYSNDTGSSSKYRVRKK